MNCFFYGQLLIIIFIVTYLFNKSSNGVYMSLSIHSIDAHSRAVIS